MRRVWILSEKTLSLSQQDWDNFIATSKAKPKSKKRYETERKRYLTLQKTGVKYVKKQFNFKTKRVIQKEGYFGRSVWFATANYKLKITKANYNAFVPVLKHIFYASMHYKLNAKFAGFKVRYNIVISNRKSETDEYIGSTIQYVDEYKFAVDNLLYKIRHIVFSASVNGIIINREITKFYSGVCN